MYNLSAAEAQRFAEVVRNMTEKIKELGPNPIRKHLNPQTLKPSNP
jgi:coenzyme F420-reducing hydrogenase delta subunit